jgi:hypothetical protein
VSRGWGRAVSVLARRGDRARARHLPSSPPSRTPLHRALHYGHAPVVALLLAAGASLTAPDSRGRTPLDLASTRCAPWLAAERASPAAAGDAYSWGDGGHFALGRDAAGPGFGGPARVPALRAPRAVALAAAKFHSAAVTADGTLLTWGAARGGRLGHAGGGGRETPSGGAAVDPAPALLPPRTRVVAVALGKHHTLAASDDGAVFAWGSNRDGRLGVPGVDSAPTPRRVSSLKARVVAVAAANRHSAAVDAGGRVWAWGANGLGQVGEARRRGGRAARAPLPPAHTLPILFSTSSGTARTRARRRRPRAASTRWPPPTSPPSPPPSGTRSPWVPTARCGPGGTPA